MKKSDLYREWARVLDMCELTKVKPESCWKYAGFKTDQHIPEFAEDYNKYEFAVAILEGKPVFVGDRLYFKGENVPFIWHDECRDMKRQRDEYELYANQLSWNQSKKTFMLDGVELPCPDAEDGYMFLLSSTTQKKKYYFNSLQDRNKFANGVIDLIEDALK